VYEGEIYAMQSDYEMDELSGVYKFELLQYIYGHMCAKIVAHAQEFIDSKHLLLLWKLSRPN